MACEHGLIDAEHRLRLLKDELVCSFGDRTGNIRVEIQFRRGPAGSGFHNERGTRPARRAQMLVAIKHHLDIAPYGTSARASRNDRMIQMPCHPFGVFRPAPEWAAIDFQGIIL